MTYIYLYLSGNLQGPKSKQLKKFLFWSILFGPILFPFSLIVWHAYQLYKGESNFLIFKNVARWLTSIKKHILLAIMFRSRVLNSLSVMTKSALQISLQTSILMITWNQDGRNYVQPYITYIHTYRLLNVVLAVLVLASSATDHHYFGASGKNVKGFHFLNVFDTKRGTAKLTFVCAGACISAPSEQYEPVLCM